jgi:tetratricopeptide (TPR) repeat protein
LTAYERCRSAYHALSEGEEKQREAKHYSDACYQQGKLFLEAGNYEKAIERLQEACELRPKDAFAHYSLGKAYVAREQYEEAIQVLEEARLLAGKPEHYISDRLAQAYAGEGRLEEALKIYEQMPISMRQQWAYIMRNMGEVYIRLEMWDQAKKVLEEASRKDRRNHNAYYFLGLVYQAKEQWADAVAALGKAVKLRQQHQNKSFPEAASARDAILEEHPDAKAIHPKRQPPVSVSQSGRQIARVKMFSDRGFGFLVTDDGDLFFHISQVEDRGEVQVGELLEYEVGTGKDGRPAAVKLRVPES